MRRLAWTLWALLGCTSSNPATPDAGARDVPVSDINAVDTGGDELPPPWPHTLESASVMGAARGWTTRRVIVHAHSVHSHDACDGNPYVDGGPNLPCLEDFRRSLCALKLDAVFLTEHAERVSWVPLETVLQAHPGDEVLREGSDAVGLRITCADGHRTVVFPGAENELMPVALRRHPVAVNGDLERTYHADDPAGVARFREAGALVAIAHTEQRTIEQLRTLSPDLIELYNIHANLDPRIAGPYLNYDIGPAFADLLRFARSGPELEPDWAFLTFFVESQNDLTKWGQLLGEGRRMPAVAGSDAHQNTLSMVLSDGERGDSYRRIFRFFSNELLVRGEPTRASMLDALQQGRLFVAFEALGTPEGFSYTAEAGGVTREIGEEVPLAMAPTLVTTVPTVRGLNAALPRPTVRARILRAEASGAWTEVAAGTDTVRYTPTQPGAYRAEVRMMPNHARPYLAGLERLVREVPWVYANAIYVR